MEYLIKDKDIWFKQKDFSLSETLDCGQSFRWTPLLAGNGYKGFFGENALTITKNSDDDYFVLHNQSEEQFLNIWVEYFDLNTDYKILKETFSDDEILKKACAFAGGIRLLKQDKWEALCSFIISQNNNIPRIKGIINRICEEFGIHKKDGFTFPSPEKISSLTLDELASIRSGFRARYILDAAKKITSGEINLEDISNMELPQARIELMKICGVGAKVAECALLYGMYRVEAFPIDVWIKRVLANYYPQGLPECIKGYEGIAQQYLFHYIRNL